MKIVSYGLAALCLLIMQALFVAASADDFSDGVSMYNQRNFKMAINKFNSVIQSAPDNSSAMYYLGTSYQSMGLSDKARSCYQKVLDKFPGSQAASYAAQALGVTVPFSALGQGQTQSAGNGAPVKSTDVLPNETTIPFTRGTGKHMFVNAYINGRAVNIMFDTGAAVSAIGKDTFQAAGLTIPKKSMETSVSGVGGSAKANAFAAVVEIGGIKRLTPLVVVDEVGVPPLLGETFYDVYNYQIDNPAGLIRFAKKGTNTSRSSDCIKVPFVRSGNNLVVTVKVNGTPCQMYFDTGAAGGVSMDSMTAQRLGLSIPDDAAASYSAGVGGVSRAVRFYVDRVELGPILRTHIPIAVQATPMGLPLLGEEFFRDRPFTINYQDSVIEFQH